MDPSTELPPELRLEDQARMVDGLQAWLQLRRPQAQVERIETHISFVLIDGQFAYKLKKAINPGFLDFTTRARRLHFCEEELRLNRRLAADLYLDVVPVTGSVQAPALGGPGPAIDHAVRMRAFAQDGLWDRLARRGELAAGDVDQLAEQLDRFHRQTPQAAAGTTFGQPRQVRAPMLDNLAVLRPLLVDAAERQALDTLQRWEAAEFAAIEPLLLQRCAQGRVRECHGDLHLGNVVRIDGRCTVFDCIEFNDDFRWIDVMSEVAFMAMDLLAHGCAGLSHRFVNAYLERSGDYAGARLLRYLVAYRALVRAKVVALRALQSALPAAARDAGVRPLLDLALTCAGTTRPALLITHGLSGSGKTTGSQQLLQELGAVRIRADVERKRMFGLDAKARSASGLGEGLYTAAASAATYARLRELALPVLAGGRSVVLDATFASGDERDAARRLAAGRQLPFFILDFRLEPALLGERVRARALRGGDASEAGLQVLQAQLQSAQPLADEEQDLVVDCPAATAPEEPGYARGWQAVAQEIRHRIGCWPAASGAVDAVGTAAPGRWFEMQLQAPGRPLQQVWRERLPPVGEGQVRIEVAACGVCRTDLHLVDGELAFPGHPVVPGHEIVGRIGAVGAGVHGFEVGQRVGVPWLGWTCGRCAPCRAGRENLCEQARFTGWQIAGGYAQQALADARYVFPLPGGYDDEQAAPLLCAGLIGYRAYAMAGSDAQRIGLYGFGAAAHLIAQVAVHQGREVHAFTRPGDLQAQDLARTLGVAWAGGSDEVATAALDAALLFAPVGALVPLALRAVRPGGVVVCAGIHMSDIPAFPYALLWQERRIQSVANLTRRDGHAFLRIAAEVPLQVHTRCYELAQAQQALDDLRAGRFSGAAVLRCRPAGAATMA